MSNTSEGEMHDIVDRLRDTHRYSGMTEPLDIEAADEIERLRSALRFIVNLEGGSRGAYSKFASAQKRAAEALEP